MKMFFIKIQKMETKLNIWVSRDLTLIGRTLFVKALRFSKLIYSTSMLTIVKEVIKRVEEKLFNFLCRDKQDKIKRCPISQAKQRWPILLGIKNNSESTFIYLVG